MAHDWGDDPWTADPDVQRLAELVLTTDELRTGDVHIDGVKTGEYYHGGIEYIPIREGNIRDLEKQLASQKKQLMFLYAVKAVKSKGQ